ncbi:hypothetical protein [Cohnella silvisoli]|uniref:DUF1659 domain-containing protein n=1 Tax=Cohnella silvisoli TaxID=2873699 RepID=A0ABV1L350_9BACL|nr:hypothetical protein [Cohnella silvisoli]MCD9026021.1 hypothetical protein [Cohnella silvisoli]
MTGEILKLYTVAEEKAAIIKVAFDLTSGESSPEEAAVELLKIAKGMHQEETVLIDNAIKKSSIA